jgi:hypothetical protein
LARANKIDIVRSAQKPTKETPRENGSRLKTNLDAAGMIADKLLKLIVEGGRVESLQSRDIPEIGKPKLTAEALRPGRSAEIGRSKN